MEQIQELVQQKMKPYLDRIQLLEDQDKLKNAEIITLKHAIANLNTIIENQKPNDDKKHTVTKQVRPQTAVQTKTPATKEIEKKQVKPVPVANKGVVDHKKDLKANTKNTPKKVAEGAHQQHDNKQTVVTPAVATTTTTTTTTVEGTQQKRYPMVETMAEAQKLGIEVICQTAFGHYLTMDIWYELDDKLPWKKTDEQKKRREILFSKFDPNGNGLLSMAESGKGVEDILVSHGLSEIQPVCNRAFFASNDVVQTKNPEGQFYIEKSEFRIYLLNLIKYLEYWVIFNQFNNLDSTDRRIDFDEFSNKVELLSKFGYTGDLCPKNIFNEMDDNHGGFILFDEFCTWAVKHSLKVRPAEFDTLI